MRTTDMKKLLPGHIAALAHRAVEDLVGRSALP